MEGKSWHRKVESEKHNQSNKTYNQRIKILTLWADIEENDEQQNSWVYLLK